MAFPALSLLLIAAAGAGCLAPKEKPMSPLSESILKRLDAGDTFSSAEAMTLRAEPDAARRLAAAIREGAAPRRQAGVRLLIQIGKATRAVPGVRREIPVAVVTDAEVAATLVERLTDADADVRREACVALAGLVPGDLIQPHAAAILAALRKFPTTDGALTLLGKTGTPDALRLLEERPEIGQAAPEDVRLARARLGDRDAEDAEIRAYEAAGEPRAKADAARRLGYIGTRRAATVLARDMRTPLKYVWLVQSERSFRLHLIEGLHLAFMREPVFWPPYFKPSDDSYYERIEKWLTDNLGVTWQQPRPPFLYEEDSPTPAPVVGDPKP